MSSAARDDQCAHQWFVQATQLARFNSHTLMVFIASEKELSQLADLYASEKESDLYWFIGETQILI